MFQPLIPTNKNKKLEVYSMCIMWIPIHHSDIPVMIFSTKILLNLFLYEKRSLMLSKNTGELIKEHVASVKAYITSFSSCFKESLIQV